MYKIGTEITLAAICSPKFTAGVVTAHYLGEVWGHPGRESAMYITVNYGAFSENRRLDQTGHPI